MFPAHRGILRIEGVDAKDFLQRMSTNDIAKLKSSHPIQTSFTNNKGRLFDHCLLFEIDANTLLLISSHKDADTLYNWLEQFHFVEDFILKDATEEFSFLHIVSRSQGQVPKTPNSIIFWQGRLDGISLDFIGMLKQNGDTLKPECDQKIWQALRIAALMPDHPHEINDSWMLQNVNLRDAIADNKGCYIGQEVINKALTYQKQVKTLKGARLSPLEFATIKESMLIKSSIGELGLTTSVAPLYLEGEINALLIADPPGSSANSASEGLLIKQPFCI